MSRPERDEDPITLKEACEMVFRNTVTPATLRAEAGRGRLEISRIGKRDFTTLVEIPFDKLPDGEFVEVAAKLICLVCNKRPNVTTYRSHTAGMVIGGIKR